MKHPDLPPGGRFVPLPDPSGTIQQQEITNLAREALHLRAYCERVGPVGPEYRRARRMQCGLLERINGMLAKL